ncbi:unnamed protein product [Adineta steineri]|uniref:F-box domain-containing protein n=1 Tax=Adineta steineri TaxID=433720 RepID=A0A814GIE3_9BILA|nr:unnamed protein product [Adineta steineri]CAF0996820.1 unnamed protein product [Adineta steineri]
MSNSTLNIVDLCDELLLNILNKLNNVDVLYSLIGVNKKLDRLARDITFTQSINLVTTLSNEHDNSILDRFCLLILQRIQHNIECLTLNSLSVDRVLRIGNYSKLHKLSLVNLPIEMACRIFNDESSLVYTFRHQISHLIVTINIDNKSQDILEIWYSDLLYSPNAFIDSSSRPYYSSNISYLNVRLNNFNDCICLLNADLSQLQTLVVEIDTIDKTLMTINTTKIVSNLKCFSLISFHETIEYDAKIVPLLQHMSKLEKLILSLIVDQRNSFIDGNHLVNGILSKMPDLHTFIFNIITKRVIIEEEFLPTCDNILRPLIEKEYNAGCYTDYCTFSKGQCHIYSLPFTFECMHIFTSKFPDGLFVNVRHFVAGSDWHPFEHEFFAQISKALPLLNKLTVRNTNGQEKKLPYLQAKYEQTSSVIEFPHLTILNVGGASLDYVEQFLFDFYTRLTSLHTLHVEYELLLFATQYFTEDAARANCLKVKHIFFDRRPEMFPENFRNYFPLL